MMGGKKKKEEELEVEVHLEDMDPETWDRETAMDFQNFCQTQLKRLVGLQSKKIHNKPFQNRAFDHYGDLVLILHCMDNQKLTSCQTELAWKIKEWLDSEHSKTFGGTQ